MAVDDLILLAQAACIGLAAVVLFFRRFEPRPVSGSFPTEGHAFETRLIAPKIAYLRVNHLAAWQSRPHPRTNRQHKLASARKNVLRLRYFNHLGADQDCESYSI
jgi:hypothetical protein